MTGSEVLLLSEAYDKDNNGAKEEQGNKVFVYMYQSAIPRMLCSSTNILSLSNVNKNQNPMKGYDS